MDGSHDVAAVACACLTGGVRDSLTLFSTTYYRIPPKMSVLTFYQSAFTRSRGKPAWLQACECFALRIYISIYLLLDSSICVFLFSRPGLLFRLCCMKPLEVTTLRSEYRLTPRPYWDTIGSVYQTL